MNSPHTTNKTVKSALVALLLLFTSMTFAGYIVFYDNDAQLSADSAIETADTVLIIDEHDVIQNKDRHNCDITMIQQRLLK